MRKWTLWLLVPLFLSVCMLFAHPMPVPAELHSLMQFVTASGWTAVALIVVFLCYAMHRTGKR